MGEPRGSEPLDALERVYKRICIFGYLLWTAVLAVVLLSAGDGPPLPAPEA